MTNHQRLNPDDFPIFDEDLEDRMKIDSEKLLGLVNSTSFSMGYQDARHFLNGLYIEFTKNKVTAVATDGHRLAKFKSNLLKTYISRNSQLNN